MEKYPILIISLIIVILISNFCNSLNDSNEIIINEILANPLGNDNNKEFIEIKGTNNLSDYIIGDNSQNDSLEVLNFNTECNFSLIVEEGFEYNNYNCSIYSAGTTIGNGLSNSGEIIYLYYNNSLVDYVEYIEINEGYSYSKETYGWNTSININGTPCYENFNLINDTLNSNNSFNNNTNISLNLNTTIIINNTNNLSINDTINETNISNNICNISINIELNNNNNNNSIYKVNNKIEFYNILSNSNNEYLIEYWITDYYNETLKQKYNTSNMNKKSWTARTDKEFDIIKIKNRISYLNCSNINKNNSELILFLVNDEYEINEIESNEEILETDITFEKLTLNENYLEIKALINKGDTSKSVLNLNLVCKDKNNLELESNKIKIYINKKFYSQELNIKIPFEKYECCFNPRIEYYGLDLENNIEIIDFERSNMCEIDNNDNAELENNDLNKNSILKIKPESQIFYYNSINNSNKTNEIDENLIKINQKINYSNDTNQMNNKITGNSVKNIDFGNQKQELINYSIIILILISLIIIFFKKW